MPDLLNGTTVTMDGFADAQINTDRGTVVVTTDRCKEYADWKSWGEQAKEVFGPESYHGSDFSFFYYNIRENAVLRAKKWFEKYKQRVILQMGFLSGRKMKMQ